MHFLGKFLSAEARFVTHARHLGVRDKMEESTATVLEDTSNPRGV